jgi:hypothetical protein
MRLERAEEEPWGLLAGSAIASSYIGDCQQQQNRAVARSAAAESSG